MKHINRSKQKKSQINELVNNQIHTNTMQQNLVDPTTANNISYIMNLLFDVLGIVLILIMIFTLVKLYRKIKEMIKNEY
jgi:hypothetical protein